MSFLERRDTRFYQVLINRPMLPWDAADYKKAATKLGLHTEVIQAGKRFINPQTGQGENAPDIMPHVYITGPIGQVGKLEAGVRAIEFARFGKSL